MLIPAHNEAKGIARTLDSIFAQLEDDDEVWVIADNCDDDTAAVARAGGARVVERRSELRGKGYALSFGVESLAADPPDVVIIVDADCELAPGCIAQLVAACVRRERPAQADYTMALPDEPTMGARLSCFAFLVRNRVRPAGLARLGLQSHLSGSGMCFPWRVLRDAPATAGHIAEDLLLGIELALQQKAPVFCPQARVTSQLASTAGGQNTQRQRWEHGHLSLLRTHLAKLVTQGLKKGDREMLANAADLAVPPLSLHGLLLLGAEAVALLAAPFAGPGPLVLVSLECLAVAGGVLGAWSAQGRSLLPGRFLVGAVPYALAKLPSYVRLGRGRGVKAWQRTERRGESAANGHP